MFLRQNQIFKLLFYLIEQKNPWRVSQRSRDCLQFTVYGLRFRVSILGLKGGVVGAWDEAGTVFRDVGELPVADDAGVGVFGCQVFEQGEHRCLLSLGTGVGRAAILVETALVADANGAAVVVAGMGSTEVLWEDRYDGAVATDIIMIGGLAEASDARSNQRFHAEGPIAARGATVNHKEFHGIMF